MWDEIGRRNWCYKMDHKKSVPGYWLELLRRVVMKSDKTVPKKKTTKSRKVQKSKTGFGSTFYLHISRARKRWAPSYLISRCNVLWIQHVLWSFGLLVNIVQKVWSVVWALVAKRPEIRKRQIDINCTYRRKLNWKNRREKCSRSCRSLDITAMVFIATMTNL